MSFELFCMALIALGIGLAFIFGGYRLFLILLPIWGFFFGFGLGAQSMQVLFGVGFLATVTSWVVGLIVGALFAVLAYLFYLLAVAILAASVGYGLAVGLLTWIGMSFGFLVWIIGIVAAVVLAFVVIRFNIQKYFIIAATAVAGTGVIIFTLLAMFGGSPADLLLAPVVRAISNSFWWLLFFVVAAGSGIYVQIIANRSFEIDTYNRLEA